MQKAKQAAEDRPAGHESARAINRVQHPDPFGIRAFRSMFFADHAMIRQSFGQKGANRFLGLTIRAGHGAGIALGFHQKRRPKQRPDHRRCPISGGFRHRDEVLRDQGAGAFGEIERR